MKVDIKNNEGNKTNKVEKIESRECLPLNENSEIQSLYCKGSENIVESLIIIRRKCKEQRADNWFI